MIRLFLVFPARVCNWSLLRQRPESLMLRQQSTNGFYFHIIPVGFPLLLELQRKEFQSIGTIFQSQIVTRLSRQKDRREISLLNLTSSNMAKATAMTLCLIPHNKHRNFFFPFSVRLRLTVENDWFMCFEAQSWMRMRTWQADDNKTCETNVKAWEGNWMLFGEKFND